MGAGRLPGSTDRGYRIYGGDSEDRRIRSSAADSLRRLRRRAMGLGTDHLDHRHPHHAGGVDPRGRPVGHQANARVLIRGPGRLHPDRCRRRIGCRYRQHDVLPHRVRLHDDRCVCDHHHGPGRWWRSNKPRNVVGHRPQVSGRRIGVRRVHARPRGHPADLRIRRQVRRLCCGDRGWHGVVGDRRRGGESHRCVLLRPGDCGHVLRPAH